MPRVLIVDDSPDQARFAAALLEQSDFEVEIASTGEQALEVVAATPPDVIVTDLVMPGLSGLDVVEAVTSSNPGLPVVLMTAHGNGEIATRALRAGAASYVPKRLLAEVLADTVTDTYELSCSQRAEARVREYVVRSSIDFELENDPTLVNPLVNYLQGHVVRQVGPHDESQFMQLGVAVHEAMINAMMHGNLEITSEIREGSWTACQQLISERRADPRLAARRVRFRARLDMRTLTVEIDDEGDGFDPAQVPDPTGPDQLLRASGRGLYLIRTFMDEVSFNDRGNRITMVARLNEPVGAVEDDDGD